MNAFSTIDRQAHIRTNASQLDELENTKGCRIIIWHKNKVIVTKGKQLSFTNDDIDLSGSKVVRKLFLGIEQKNSYFCLQLDGDLSPKINLIEDCDASQKHAVEFVDLRTASLFANKLELGLLFYSQGLLNWHHSHSYCANCGGSTKIVQAGHARQCQNLDCKKQHFPRIEPAVIFSIVNHSVAEPKILLARQAAWEDKRYSVLAGFVEHGESMEDAVKREAFEEVGIKVEQISYVNSQPWPFPSSLMIGFDCITHETEINLIDDEIEKAAWFSAAEIENQIKEGQLKLPFSVSISWYLINRWFTQQQGYSLNDFLNTITNNNHIKL